MVSPQKKETPGQFQKGYHAVPISEADKNSALRLCAVVREAPDPVAGVFLLLRDTLEASIYLGGLLDAGGYVHHWIELWIQNVNNLETTLESHREVFTNHLLDERWKRRAAFLGRLDRSDKIEMSFETAHPLPIYFDLTVSGPVTPKDAAFLVALGALRRRPAPGRTRTPAIQHISGKISLPSRDIQASLPARDSGMSGK